ncbi:hypothetical protein AJ79_00559 [Helicocarpus griseus UAMH5409]|uniref:Major facilitator superfamily (MFS) profile domain-containing protein n=1 Tax=Helicocarpus griseus UAMH5409 TaxID=1447875 RepID=A0A2B7YAY7_9EURO|nr:hypothetical protein AJ79_00559 [Helicocarpus griseus UAMH5409]
MAGEKPVANMEDVEAPSTGTIQYSIFGKWKKRYIVGLVGVADWFSLLSNFIYYPAITAISNDLRLSIADINLSITICMIVSAIAPSITGAASDVYGRRPLFLVTIFLYCMANLGLALQSSLAGLLMLRMLQRAFSTAYGVVADVAMPSERGSYVAVVSFGVTSAPSIGPLLGGALAYSPGWRWIFWLLLIISATFLTAMALFLPETARGVVGNGSIKPPLYCREPKFSCIVRRESSDERQTAPLESKKPSLNPLKSLNLLLAKDNATVVFSSALLYTTFCCIHASLGTLFVELYHLNQLQSGLIYLPFGIGCTISAVTSGRIIDRDYRKTADLHGLPIDRVRGDDLRNFPIEEERLRSVFIPLVATVLSVISFGWVVEKKAPITAPLVIQFVSGVALQQYFNTINTLRVDINPTAPPAAQASSNLVRCTLAAVTVAVLQQMIDKIGAGWTYTFFGCLCSISGFLFIMERKMGMKWRLRRLENDEQ